MSTKRGRRRAKVRPTPGSTQAPINPGFGGMQSPAPGRNAAGSRSGKHPGIPTGNPPAGPARARPGAGDRGGDGGVGGQSKYNELPPQPPNTITDVDLGNNWFSPFQPITPFGPPYVGYAREWDYQVGENLNYIPERLVLMQQLRGMAETWGVLRAIIETRKDQVIRLPWEFQVKDKPRARNKGVEALEKFFKAPDGKHDFDAWMRMILEDLFVIDAPSIYMGRMDNFGRPLSLDVVDGATIRPLIDDAGRRPDYPQPAFQQIIKGLPMINMDEMEMCYRPMRPRSQLPIFGYSPVEQIYIEITEAIRKTFYQLNFWVEGNLPDLIMSVPENWTPRQIAQFQALMDANLSGNLQQKSKIRFVPHGMNPYDIKNASGQETWATRDEMLIRLACYAFSVSPQPFIRQMNRATAQSANEEAEQEGLFPLIRYLTGMMNYFIERLGYEDCHWVVLPQQEADQLKRSQVNVNNVKAGLRSINEIRDEEGKTPIPGGEEVLIYTNNGVMTLSDAISLSHIMAKGPQGGKAESTTGSNTPQTQRGVDAHQQRNPPANPKGAGLNVQDETPYEGPLTAEVIPLFGTE